MEIVNKVGGAVAVTLALAALTYAGSQFSQFKADEREMYKNIKAVYEKHWRIRGKAQLDDFDKGGKPALKVNRRGTAEHYQPGQSPFTLVRVTELSSNNKHQIDLLITGSYTSDENDIAQLNFAAADALGFDGAENVKEIRIQIEPAGESESD